MRRFRISDLRLRSLEAARFKSEFRIPKSEIAELGPPCFQSEIRIPKSEIPACHPRRPQPHGVSKRHAGPAEVQEPARLRVLRRQALGAAGRRGHGGARFSLRRPALLDGQGERPADRDAAGAADARAARAGQGALRDLLHALPRPDGQRPRRHRAARPAPAAVLPHRPPARVARGLLLRRPDPRLRLDARLRGADPAVGPLGDRRLHPRAAALAARLDRRRARRRAPGPRERPGRRPRRALPGQRRRLEARRRRGSDRPRDEARRKTKKEH